MDISHPTVNVFGFCWECHNNNNHRRHANEVGLFVLCKSTEIGGNRDIFNPKLKGFFFEKIAIKLPKNLPKLELQDFFGFQKLSIF